MKIYDRADADTAEKLIRRLEKRICCIKAAAPQVFSTIVSINYSCPLDVVIQVDGYDVGTGISGTYANIGLLVAALNIAYSGFAVFSYSDSTITVTMTSRHGGATLDITENCP